MQEYPENFGLTLLNNIGSFWTSSVEPESYTYLEGVFDGFVTLYEQTSLNLLEALQSVSRFDIPIYHTELWNKFILTISDIEEANEDYYTMNDGLLMDNGFQAGDTKEFITTFKIPLNTTKIANIAQLCDKPINPNVVWVNGTDFYVDFENNQLICNKDPLQHFAQFPEIVDGEAIYVLKLWGINVQEDLQYVYNHFGYAVGIYASKSDENYKKIVNAFYDVLMRSSNSLAVRIAIAGLLGVPLVENNGEIVQSITQRLNSLQIATDKNVYEYNKNAVAVVNVSDTVYAGDVLADSLTFIEDRDISNLNVSPAGVKFTKNMVQADISDSIVFENSSAPVTVTVSSGNFLVEIGTTGDSGDIITFWNYSKTAQAEDTSLWVNLGRPTDNTTVDNAMQFILNNFLRASFLVGVKFEHISATINNIKLLRRLMPAHVSLLFFVDYGDGEDIYNETEINFEG